MKAEKDQFPTCQNCGGKISPTQKSQSVKDSSNMKSMSEFHTDAHDCEAGTSKMFPRGGRSGTADTRDWDYGDKDWDYNGDHGSDNHE